MATTYVPSVYMGKFVAADYVSLWRKAGETETQYRYRWFRERGNRPKQALGYARAEQFAAKRDWVFSWEWDDYTDLTWMETEEREKDHECWGCVLKNARGEVLDSLWGIVDPSNAYRREIEAELACNGMAAIEDAIRAGRPSYCGYCANDLPCDCESLVATEEVS